MENTIEKTVLPEIEGLSEEQNAALLEMCDLLSNNAQSDFILEFFDRLFTRAELKDFATRWLLVRALDSGMTQREIAQKYHVSLCKITRGSKELKKPGSAFKKMLEMAKKKS